MNNEETMQTYSRTEDKKRKKRKERLSFVITILVAVSVALCLRFFVFEFIIVKGPSMEPTLYTGEVVFVEKVSYKFHDPARFDVIICDYPGHDDSLVKRVIGIAGDTVEVREGKLYLNGELIEEPYFQDIMYSDFGPYTVEEGTVFVMGDNRNDSLDSRDARIGPIDIDTITGRGVAVIWPFNKIGQLK